MTDKHRHHAGHGPAAVLFYDGSSMFATCLAVGPLESIRLRSTRAALSSEASTAPRTGLRCTFSQPGSSIGDVASSLIAAHA